MHVCSSHSIAAPFLAFVWPMEEFHLMAGVDDIKKSVALGTLQTQTKERKSNKSPKYDNHDTIDQPIVLPIRHIN